MKNDDDFVKYVRKQDDLRNEIMEKNKLASEREICLDFEEQLKIRQDIMKHFLVSENDVYNKEVILKGADRKLKISLCKRLLERESEQTNTEIKLENGRLARFRKSLMNICHLWRLNIYMVWSGFQIMEAVWMKIKR